MSNPTSPSRSDIVVVGGGIAGCMAALSACQTVGGSTTITMVHKAGGATPSWSGAVDVACDLVDTTPGIRVPGLARGGAITDNIARLARLRPRHPYARFDGSDDDSGVADALKALVDAAADIDLVGRDDGHNHVLATALGTVKRGALVARSQHLDLADLAGTGACVGIVEWRDLAGFSARPVVDMLRFAVSLGVSAPPFAIEPVVVPRVLSGDVFRDSRAMARAFDDEAVRARFLAALKAAASAHPITLTHLLLPATLGTRGLGSGAMATVEAAVGLPVRELLALPPSSPAERLQRALRATCEARGIVAVDGNVSAPRFDGDRLVGVTIGRGAEQHTMDCGALVLASGRFYGGGLVRDQVAREALFGAPVVSEGTPIDDQFIGAFTGEHVDADHAIFRAGVAIDSHLRPLDRHRRPLAENVVAAGSIIEGYDPARDGSGLGVAAWTGWLAGQRACEGL